MHSLTIEAPAGIDENAIDIDGTMVKRWRLVGGVRKEVPNHPVPGVLEFMKRSSQVNTCLSFGFGKRGRPFQLEKIEKFDLRKYFEQHNRGGGIYICEESPDEKKDRLAEIAQRFLSRHEHGDLKRLAVIGNNCKCELQYGIDIGATVIRMRQKEDPYSDDDLIGDHHEVPDWYGVMALPFYRLQYEDILARRA